MYTEADFKNTTFKARMRLAMVILLAIAFIAVMLVFNARRNMFFTCATAAVGFIVCYFIWSFKVSPWLHYNRHLRDVRTGQKRTTECEFVYFTPETRIHDGVEVHDFVVTVGPEEEDERLFYWDHDKTAPELTPGTGLRITSYGNFIIGLETPGASDSKHA